METNEDGEQVEVTKEEWVEAEPPKFMDFGIKGNVQREVFREMMIETNKLSAKNKSIVRLNNGDVVVLDKDEIPEECKDPLSINGTTRVPGYMWFTRDNYLALKKMYRERINFDEEAEIKEPWWTSPGMKKRMDRWESLKV